MHVPTALFTAILLAPPALMTEPPPAGRAYEEIIASVGELNEGINVGDPVRTELFDALAELPAYAPTLAEDPEHRAIRTRAQLNLARSYLSAGENDSASGVMDEVLRSTIGEEVPVEEFGPSLMALHADRLAALEAGGTGQLTVNCQFPCRVFVNERLASEEVEGLYLGVYRVWVEGADDKVAGKVHFTRVQLNELDQTVTVDFVPYPKPKPRPVPQTVPQPTRLLARGSEIAIMVLGLGAATIGTVVLATNPYDSQTRTIVGATIAGLGGVALISGAVTLSVDEVRLGQWRGRQATLAWTMQF